MADPILAGRIAALDNALAEFNRRTEATIAAAKYCFELRSQSPPQEIPSRSPTLPSLMSPASEEAGRAADA